MGRRSPSLCLFRKRFLYCFGGTQFRFGPEETELPVEAPQLEIAEVNEDSVEEKSSSEK